MPKQLLLISFVLLAVSGLQAKCGNSILYIDGSLTGSAANSIVTAHVTPDPNWEPQPAVSVDKSGTFRAIIYFDRTKPEGRIRDNCS
ncbi:MAG TPA: hypothetical protein VI424_11385, partial [Terriglobales bacterium]